MKNPTEPILTARTAFLNTRAILESSRGHYEMNKPLLQDAIINADLTTREGVQNITTLQTLDYALPLRIAALESQVAAEEAALISEVNTFIAGTLGPRVREAQGRAREQVTAELRPHYSDSIALERHVAASGKVARFSALAPSIAQTPHEGALNFAQSALDAWEKLAELEAKP